MNDAKLHIIYYISACKKNYPYWGILYSCAFTLFHTLNDHDYELTHEIYTNVVRLKYKGGLILFSNTFKIIIERYWKTII